MKTAGVMKMEIKIYSSWAFTENEREKAKINREIYNELKSKYKVYRHDFKQDLKDKEDVNFEDYDVIIGRSACYSHGEYTIHKNAPNLRDDELALLCDCGNLCFGYMVTGLNGIHVSED